MKKLRILTLTLCCLMLTMAMAMSQSRKVAEIQDPVEWPHYQKTWFKAEKKNLLEAISQTKKANKSPKRRDRKADKLANLRTKLSELSARKEASDV